MAGVGSCHRVGKYLDVHLPVWELHRLVVREGVLGDAARLESQQCSSEVALRHLQRTRWTLSLQRSQEVAL